MRLIYYAVVKYTIINVKPRLHDTTSCQTDLTTILNEQPLFVQPVVNPDCTTGLTTGCIPDTDGCQTPFECLYTRYNRLSNRYDNQLYHVNGGFSNLMFCTVHVLHNSAQNMQILHEIWSFGSQENHLICCHQMSDFKAKVHQIRFWPQTLLGELTTLPRPASWIRGAYF